MDEAFDENPPLLVFNTLQTETEYSEHARFMHLLKGLLGTFRNITSHIPKIKWLIDEQNAVDMLIFTSLLHRKLDQCVRKRDL